MPVKRSLARGGARNRADRQSRHLTRHQCDKLRDAAERALAAGLPFNRFITILWQRGGVDAANNAAATGAFIKRAADWLDHHGGRLAWAWVQENSRNNGAHVHILLHVPPTLDPLFRVMPSRWAKAILPGPCLPGTVQTQRVRGAQSLATMPALYCANLDRKLGYMQKGALPAVGAALGLARHGEASLVTGKRLGVWQRRRAPPAGKGQVA